MSRFPVYYDIPYMIAGILYGMLLWIWLLALSVPGLRRLIPGPGHQGSGALGALIFGGAGWLVVLLGTLLSVLVVKFH